MKNNSRKILLALLLVFTMLVGMTSIVASAADDVTISLIPGSDWSADGARFAAYCWNNAGNAWYDLTDSDGDGTYDATVPSDYTKVIFCRMNPDSVDNTWENKWNQTADLDFSANDTFTVTDPWAATGATGTWANGGNVSGGSESIEQFSSYTVAGTAGLCGSEWTPEDSNNDMTLVDGVYTKVFEGVAAGTHEFKVVADYSWDNAWPGSNYVFTLDEDGCTVTITFNHQTGAVKVSAVNSNGESVELGSAGGNQGGADASGTYTVAGESALCYSEWNTADTYNDMILNAETGLYEKTFTGIPAGTYKCKVVANHSWDVNWGGTEDNTDADGNYLLTTFDEHDITITFNPATGEVKHELSESTGVDNNRPLPEAPDIDLDDTITVYLSDSANWGTPYFYCWTQGSSDQNAGWPGVEMQWDGERLVFYAEVPRYYVNIIFNGGSGAPQTADLLIPGDGALYDNTTNTWSDINNYTPPIPPENTTEDVTVYVKDTAGWNTVYIYFWDANGLEACSWPGVEMTKDDNGLWTYTIPSGFCSVIFNGGLDAGQTPDLLIPVDGKVYLENGNPLLSNDGIADDNKAWQTLPSDAETPDNPGETPDDPGETPDNPGETPDNPGETPDNPGETPDDPGADEPAKEMTWLQKIAMSILLWLRNMEAFFKNMFAPKQ